ncbi:MAG: PEP-CTERM sorting domain-containing protein [Phycisphaerae bacterium]|nr:PEP-CTERM sorting domain-containing protein [Phycisphaerae bacterium]
MRDGQIVGRTNRNGGLLSIAMYFLLVAVSFLAVGEAEAATTVQAYGPFTVTFHNNGDTDGYITGQQDWTAEQMADVGASIQMWSQYIDNTPGRQVAMHAFWRELDSLGTNVLGGAASYMYSDGGGTTVWALGEYVWKEGVNPGTTGFGFDTVIDYDITAAGLAWNFGTDAPGAGQIDFRSVVAHEIGHSLGFVSTYDLDYDDFGWFGSTFAGLTAWDKGLVDDQGNKPLSGGTGTPDDFNEVDDPVYWDGLNAVSYYGDSLVPIYAPDPWQQGSSLSHLDEATFPTVLMSPSIAAAQAIRQPSNLEWMMMKDMGWDIVPEPGTLLLLALGSIGVLLRRRRRR